MVHAGKVTRDILWENNVLNSYILLMKDTFWQINAIDAIFAWYIYIYIYIYIIYIEFQSLIISL